MIEGPVELNGFLQEKTRVIGRDLSKIGAYHHTLSTYVNRLVEAGLGLERLCEPQASGHAAERVPGYGEVPAVLVARCRKS
jgi:hypothetical protein